MASARRASALLAGCALGIALGACRGPANGHVLIVVNEAQPISLAIGEYYRARRRVPPENVVAIRWEAGAPDLSSAAHETIGRADFVTHVREPIERFLRERDLVDRIEIVVTTKGVPLRVAGAPVRPETLMRDSTRAAVDAELALLFSGRDGEPGVVANPYFDATQPFAAFRVAHPEAPLRYLVARLTGYQDDVDPATGLPADVKALVDRAQAPARLGTFLIDEDPVQESGRQAGNPVLLRPAAATLAALGLAVVHDRSPRLRSDVADITGYSSWGSNDTHHPGAPFYGEIAGARYPGRFTSRALVADFVSTNARSFTAPIAYGQSSVADLIRLGAAGAAGHVYEPTLRAVARPHVLLRRYAQGVPAVEAFYRSIPHLGWMNVYVGDPLMRLPPGLASPDPPDLDGDGVPNAADNCLDRPNPDQRDTDADGYGNLCDGDVDNDGVVGTSWGAFPGGDVELVAASAEARRYLSHHDLDGDGDVDDDDVSIALIGLFLPPGPSGRVPVR